MKTEIKTSLDIVQDWRRNTKIAYDKWLNVADEIAWLESNINKWQDRFDELSKRFDYSDFEVGRGQMISVFLHIFRERLAQLKSATQQDGAWRTNGGFTDKRDGDAEC